MDLLLAITVAVGGGATLVSASLSYYFFQSTRRLGRATAWMLFGEMMANGVLTTFATMEMIGNIHEVSTEISTAIRWVALVTAVATSIHMAKVIKEVENGHGDH